MAKGDFIHGQPDAKSYSSADIRKGRTETGALVAGVTLLFLSVTIKLAKKMVAPTPKQGEEADPNAEKVCVCTAKITDYSLQGNIYIDKNVPTGIKRIGVLLHELYHLKKKKEQWEGHKGELDTLLDSKSYACKDDSKTQVVQDVFAWMVQTFYGDPQGEERETERLSRALQKVIDAGTVPADALDTMFGPERLKENAANAKADGDLPLKDRFESRAIVTWDGSCA